MSCKNVFNLRNNFFVPLIISLSLSLIGIFLWPNLAYFASISDESIIELTNQERLKNNMEIVTANQLLAKAAYEKAVAIFASGQFRHEINDKKFSTWIKEAGYEYFYAGENLAIDFVTGEGAIKAWLDSPTHKKNLLSENFTEIGVAVMEGEFNNNHTTLIVQIFSSPIPTNITSNAIDSGQPGILNSQGLQQKNDNYHTKTNGGQGAPDAQNFIEEEQLLTHSAALPRSNPEIYQPLNQFRFYANYRIINYYFGSISTDQLFSHNIFDFPESASNLNYKLLVILSLMLILSELSLKPGGLKNKKIN